MSVSYKFFRALWLVFVVCQVDGEGYLLPDVYMIAVSNRYTQEPLKTVARRVAPDCITNSNAASKRKYKKQLLYI
jgi:hypothetical protein